MKSLHRNDLFGWTEFNPARNIDFHSLLWVREGGNIVVDPLPMSKHDEAHLHELGKIAWIVITNSDHTRQSQTLAEATGAKLAGPAGEQETFPFSCDRWLTDGDEIVPGLTAYECHGSKTPGELALLLDDILITGDLIRAQRGGDLNLLPDAKLSDPEQARASVRRLATLGHISSVLVGDGWHIFREGQARLEELVARL